MIQQRRLPLSVLLFLVPVLAFAQDVAVSTHPDPPPAELAAPIQGLLAKGGQRVTIGSTTIDFWWVQALSLKSGTNGGPAWSHVEEGALVGAMRLSAAHRDIRGKTMKPGVYTLRYGIQPANGDHLGVSPFRDFLLVGPAVLDTDPGPLDHDPAVEVAKKTLGVSHPAVLSLDPPVATEAPSSVRTNDQGHTSVIFEVPVARDGKSAGTLRFGLIVIGEIQA